MPTIAFRAKPETIYNMDNTVAYVRVKVPSLERRHCDMAAFRSHPKFAAYANSDLFKSLLSRATKAAGIGPYIKIGQEPAGVSIDTSGFLAQVTIEI